MESAVRSRYGGSGNEKHSVETRGGINVKVRAILISMLFVSLLSGAALAAGPFSGSWEADLTLSPLQTIPISAFSSHLITDFSFGALSLSSQSDFAVNNWLWQSFKMAATAGPFSCEANFLFEANPWVFRYANGIAAIDIGPLSFRYSLAFLGSAYSGIVRRGSMLEIASISNFITVKSITHFGADANGLLFLPQTASIACNTTDTVSPSDKERYYPIRPLLDDCLAFTEQEFIVQGCICGYASLTATTVIQTQGFVSQSFLLDIKSIAQLPINLRVNSVFDLTNHSITIAPEIVGIGTPYAGIHLMADLLTQPGGFEVTGVSLYGVDTYLSINGFGIRSLSLLDKTRYSLYETGGLSLAKSIWIGKRAYLGICGHAGRELPGYWEILGFSIQQGNQNGGLDFMVLTFFTDTNATFDWVKTEFRAQMHVIQGLTLKSTVTVERQGFATWDMGVNVSW